MFDKIQTLKGKIFIGYLLVVVILIMVSLWAINNFINLSDSINNIMVENYQSIKASESMIESLERQDSAMLMILNGHNAEGNKTFRENEQEFLKWLARAEDNITIKGENEYVNKVNETYTDYLELFGKFNEIKSDERRQFYYNEIMSKFYQLKNNIRDLRSINQDTMLNAQEKADSRANKAIISTIIISISAIAVAVIFGLYLSSIILKPIKSLKDAVQSVAERNFNQKIDVKSSDEIGELAKEFNNMIERLQEYEKLNVNKLVEERDKSKAIVNNITSPLLVTDNDNKVTMMNQTARDLFNINDKELNIHFLEIINNEELLEKLTDKNEEIDQTIDLEIEEKEYHFKVSSNSVFDSQGNRKYTVTIMEDVTKLKEIDDMKSDFVSTVSHEFRTPLTSMNMSLNMLLGEDVGEINEEQKELLEATYEDCERLNSLVNDLLDLSKIESGKIKMEFGKTNIKKVVESTMKPFESQFQEKNIELLEDNINENLVAWADSNKISWVISNLIGNALRYTPENGKITVGARRIGSNIEVYVEDTGIGISEEYQNKIFDKFVRANNNDDSASGTGLGLAISREIIEAHNGKIWVDSEEGEGSRFSFRIPRYRHVV